ncbi:SLAP domain-containing protein [Lactobacillus sp. ESL0791]|uniref:SLAP domain-containing protein n=1 Tax=Lactobacillus sp. ESL0791 TaxID=2983234 RepID=UPI0023F98EAF|nr:SLAP domain-containing protein [Lactobacillus sp. ESL0791]MDF7639337.1 SLAP domain-containing protein [Lactobacillus sp. ESL0791]
MRKFVVFILNLDSRIYVAVSETINGRRFYEFANGKRIAAGNIDGNIRKLTQNAYIYDQHAHRVGKKKLARKAKIRTYGKPVKIKGRAHYIIGDKRYVKRANFK